jgi:hypothetical protein
MHVRPGGALLCAFALLLADGGTHSSLAAWSTSPYGSGVPLNTVSTGNIPEAIAGDGSGGAFILFLDLRNGDPDLYLQHLTASGSLPPGWPGAGARVCVTGGAQTTFSMVPDGAGGVLVGWLDQRVPSNNNDIYALRLNASGQIVPGWPANGQVVSARTKAEGLPFMCPDGAGGAFLVWDLTFAAGDVDVYGAHVLGSGTVAFSGALDSASTVQKGARIAADGAGGFLVAYLDSAADRSRVSGAPTRPAPPRAKAISRSSATAPAGRSSRGPIRGATTPATSTRRTWPVGAARRAGSRTGPRCVPSRGAPALRSSWPTVRGAC